MYSGTVSAALDAVHSGIRAVALSFLNANAAQSEFKRCAEIFKRIFDKISALDFPPHTALNINFPVGVPKGIVSTGMNTQETFIDGYDEYKNGELIPSGHRDYAVLDKETDEGYCLDGYITITPITTNQTEYTMLEKLSKENFEL